MLRSAVMRGLSVAAIVLGACAGPPQRLGAEPSWRGGAARTTASGPVTFAPTSEPAARYNEPLQLAPHSPLGDAVIAAVSDAATKAGLRVPVADARLFRACAELAEVVPEEGVPGYAIVEFALQRNGIIEPSPQLLIVWGDIDSPDVIVKQLEPRLAEILVEGATARLGVGAARRTRDGAGAVVFALQSSGVQTAPIPRVAEAGSMVTIDAVVDAHYRDPEVFVTRGDGSTQRLELRAGRPGGFTAQVACAQRGRQQLEITASDQLGSTVLANFPVWCADTPPHSVTVDPARDDVPAQSPEEAERRLLAGVNRDRIAAGLPALVGDPRLEAVARGYAEEMRRTRVVAHVSPTSGSASDRLRAAGIHSGVVLENVARAYGVNEAHQGLMNSPGHRANIMSSIATHIGIGVAFGEEISGRREIFITQVFTRVPPKIDPVKAVESVRLKLAAAQRPLAPAIVLRGPAQKFADALASGRSRDEAYNDVRAQLESLGRRYQRVNSVITATTDLDSFDGAGVISGSLAEEVGIGIAQGPHPDFGEGAIWIVILLGNRR
jgi:uncharacterized protein YkwD